jgi:hypothetical protein
MEIKKRLSLSKVLLLQCITVHLHQQQTHIIY